MLTLHFGSRIVESEKKLFVSTEGFENYVRHNFESEDRKAVPVWHRSLPTLLLFYMEKLNDSSLKEI